MSTLNNESIWVDDIYQLQEDTPVLGGPGGPDNRQAQQLTYRTQYLKDLIMGLPDFREYTFFKSASDPDGTLAGLAATTEGQLFRVALGDGNEPAFTYYRNNAGVAEVVAELASQRSVAILQSLIRQYPNEETIFEKLTDDEGGLLRIYSSEKTADLHHEIRSNATETVLGGDTEGGALVRASEETVDVGPLKLRYTQMPGIRVVDSEGGILKDLSDPGDAPGSAPAVSVLDAGVYLGSRTLVAFSGEKQLIHIPSVLSDRLAGEAVLATIASTSTAAQASGKNTLEVSPDDYGSAAILNFRTATSVSDRRGASVKMVSVPAVTSASTIKVLMIGDSIGNRQGPLLLAQYLAEKGYTAQFIGTLNTSAAASDANNAAGALAECREGWMTCEFTGAQTSRFGIVQPGAESQYMALAKPDKAMLNPFLRAATSADSAALVRDNLIFDCSYYQSRFSLDTPDVVILSTGTNDVRWRSFATIYNDILDSDQIMMRQIRTAWPAAKIIRMLPGTAMEAVRNELWSTKYIQVLRAMSEAANIIADAKAVIAPTWAAVNHDSGYRPTIDEVDPLTGFGLLSWLDATHPVEASRHALYKSLAPYVAATFTNLI